MRHARGSRATTLHEHVAIGAFQIQAHLTLPDAGLVMEAAAANSGLVGGNGTDPAAGNRIPALGAETPTPPGSRPVTKPLPPTPTPPSIGPAAVLPTPPSAASGPTSARDPSRRPPPASASAFEAPRDAGIVRMGLSRDPFTVATARCTAAGESSVTSATPASEAGPSKYVVTHAPTTTTGQAPSGMHAPSQLSFAFKTLFVMAKVPHPSASSRCLEG